MVSAFMIGAVSAAALMFSTDSFAQQSQTGTAQALRPCCQRRSHSTRRKKVKSLRLAATSFQGRAPTRQFPKSSLLRRLAIWVAASATSSRSLSRSLITLSSASPALPRVLGPSLGNSLPLEIRDRIGTAAGERHDVIFPISLDRHRSLARLRSTGARAGTRA